jgi:hypothetical protein
MHGVVKPVQKTGVLEANIDRYTARLLFSSAWNKEDCFVTSRLQSCKGCAHGHTLRIPDPLGPG